MVGPVLTEVLQGARTRDELDFFADRLAALTFLETDQGTWVKAGELNHQLKRDGGMMALGDLMISTLALDHDMPVYSLNGDLDVACRASGATKRERYDSDPRMNGHETLITASYEFENGYASPVNRGVSPLEREPGRHQRGQSGAIGSTTWSMKQSARKTCGRTGTT